jgi:hypothetical protein
MTVPCLLLTYPCRYGESTRLRTVTTAIIALTHSLSIDAVIIEAQDVQTPAPLSFAVSVPSTDELPGLSLDAPTPDASSLLAPVLTLRPRRRILVLGAGYVSAPLVEYLLRRPENHVTVTSIALAEAERLAAGRERCTPLQLDVFKEDIVIGELVSSHDVIVSLVPAPCHPAIARHAIAHRRHMVTASYISPEMAALNDAAKVCSLFSSSFEPKRALQGTHYIHLLVPCRLRVLPSSTKQA